MERASLSETSLFQLHKPLLFMGYLTGFFPYRAARNCPTLPVEFKMSYFARFRAIFMIAGLCACLYYTLQYTSTMFEVETHTDVSLCQAAFTTSLLLPCFFAIICAVNNSLFATTTLKNIILEMSQFSLPPSAFKKARVRILMVTIGVPAGIAFGFLSGGLYMILRATGVMPNIYGDSAFSMDNQQGFWPQTVAGSVWILADVPVCVMFYSITCAMKAINEDIEEICNKQLLSMKTAPADFQEDQLETWAQLRKLRLDYVKLCQIVRKLSTAMNAYTYCTCFGGGVSLVINLFLLAVSWSEIVGEDGSFMLLMQLVMSALLCWGRLVAICLLMSMPVDQVEDAQRILSLLLPRKDQAVMFRPDDKVLPESPVMSGVAVFQQELEINLPIVTACNFFCIGRKTMLAILAQTSSYLVILIQFYPQKASTGCLIHHESGASATPA